MYSLRGHTEPPPPPPPPPHALQTGACAWQGFRKTKRSARPDRLRVQGLGFISKALIPNRRSQASNQRNLYRLHMGVSKVRGTLFGLVIWGSYYLVSRMGVPLFSQIPVQDLNRLQPAATDAVQREGRKASMAPAIGFGVQVWVGPDFLDKIP